MIQKEEQILRRYYQYLKLEKGFSPNTIEAYQRDLDKFINFMQEEQKDFLSDDLQLEDFQHFAAALYDVGIAPRSLARILSGLRSFYHFLVLSDLKETNPTELLEFPKRAKHLPDVLTVEEVDAMEACIDLSEREGHRNKAIIETLFSCGLRVSELCNLKMSNLYIDEGFLQVELPSVAMLVSTVVVIEAIGEVRGLLYLRHDGVAAESMHGAGGDERHIARAYLIFAQVAREGAVRDPFEDNLFVHLLVPSQIDRGIGLRRHDIPHLRLTARLLMVHRIRITRVHLDG